MNDPNAEWDYPAFTVWSENGRDLWGVSVCDERWRYAEFSGGDIRAMLFDHSTDPLELTNVVDNSEFTEIRDRMSAWIGEYAPELTATR